MNNLLIENKEDINKLCKKHAVKHLYAFGSILNENFNAASDVDLLIDFKNVELLKYFDNYMDLKESLEALLGRNVDLVEEKAIKNPVFKNVVNRNKQLVYGMKKY